MSQTRVVVVERNYDYLYDKHYQLSSERDHARATLKANTRGDRIQMVPFYPAMFSDLRNYPRTEVRIVNKDPVPKFVNRNWSGWTAQAGSMLNRLSQMGNSASVLDRIDTNNERAQVGGRDRVLFFRRPILPYATQLPPDVIFSVNDQDNGYTVGGDEELVPITRTIGTQTIYRDSDVQTDPYTPEYIVRPGEAPEVLTLATLTFEKGLPAGLHEVEMIERARHRRELEAQLPPLSDFSQSEKRMRMMEAIEREEWRVREQQIEELQQLRLEVLIKLLRQREETHQEMSNKKLDRLWNRKQKEKEHFFLMLRSKHVKALRQLLKRRKNVENRHEARDIVKDYSENSSQTWAPLMRTGQFIDRNSERFLVNSHYLSTYNGLLDLEQSLPQFVLNPKIMAPKRTELTKAGFKKRKFREEEQLQILHETIHRTTTVKSKEEKPLRFLEKLEKPIPRPPTPTIVAPEEDNESTERAIIFLQQIIRGRAIQAMMFEGKEKRKELIEELRSTHSLLANEAEIDRENKAATLTIQKQRILLEHREDRVNEEFSVVEGESTANMFDFLSKELKRLQEERRIHAIAMIAERERRIREAEQSGLRQVEERRRREQDEIFKQVVKVHQQSVDMYLKDIISENLTWTASDIARIEIEETAKRINLEAYESEVINDRLQQEGIVGDLIHNFLIPEVNKRTVQEKNVEAQRKFLYAAHKEIYEVSNDVILSGTKENTAEAEVDARLDLNQENVENLQENYKIKSTEMKDIIQEEQDGKEESDKDDQKEQEEGCKSEEDGKEKKDKDDQGGKEKEDKNDQYELEEKDKYDQDGKKGKDKDDQEEKEAKGEQYGKEEDGKNDQEENEEGGKEEQNGNDILSERKELDRFENIDDFKETVFEEEANETTQQSEDEE